MRKSLVAFALASSLTACDLGFSLTGVGDAVSCTDCWDVGGGGSGSDGSDRPSGVYSGQISMGPYPVVEGEATVYAYDPSDLVVPIDSAVSLNQGCRPGLFEPYCIPGYRFDFRGTPVPAFCGYLTRVVLWNGDSSELAPMFPTAPTPCDSLSTPGSPRNYSLPAYSPLENPFTLEGSVVIDGYPADDGIRVDILTRPSPTDTASRCEFWSFHSIRWDEVVSPLNTWMTDTCEHVYTDPGGGFRYSTTDRAQLAALCGLAIARVSLADGRILQTALESTTRATCTRRRFHDLRFGAEQRASGAVRLIDANRWAAAGEVYVEFLDASHLSTIGDGSWTLDDGTFFLWLPDKMDEPSCDLILRATLIDGNSITQRWSKAATAEGCGLWYRHLIELPGTPP